MTTSKMWKLFVKPQEDFTNCYAKILPNYKPLKCRFIVLVYDDGNMMFYHSAKECVCADDGTEYNVKNVTMMTEDDNYFIIYVEVK